MAVSYEAVLDDMVSVARQAGELTQRHFRRFRDIEIGIKGPRTSCPMPTGNPSF